MGRVRLTLVLPEKESSSLRLITIRPFQQVEDVATSPSARSCKVLLWFALSPTVLKKHNGCDRLTPKSLKILSDSWDTKYFGSWFW